LKLLFVAIFVPVVRFGSLNIVWSIIISRFEGGKIDGFGMCVPGEAVKLPLQISPPVCACSYSMLFVKKCLPPRLNPKWAERLSSARNGVANSSKFPVHPNGSSMDDRPESFAYR